MRPDPIPAPARAQAAVAVYAVLQRAGRILLLRRAGSGFHDGELGLPAGHVEAGEDALSAVVRELAEETGIVVERDSCRLALTGHAGPERPTDDAYVDLFFTVADWGGEPVIAEPDRCTELVWATPDALPGDVIPYVADALRAVADPAGPPLLLWHWDRA